MSEIADRYHRCAGAFEAKVTYVAPNHWSDQSPCEDWTARDVVGHIIVMHGAMLRPVDQELSPAPSVNDDPLGAYRSARADVEALLGDPVIAVMARNSRTCRWPQTGMIFKLGIGRWPGHSWPGRR